MEQLLKILENNARLPVEDIATMLNKSPAEVAAMMDLARAQGIIKGYKTLVDWEKAKVNRVEAVIELNVSPKKSRGFDEIAATIAAFDEVESVLLMSGGYDLQLVIKGQTFQEIALFVAKRLSPLDDVLSTATHFVLRTYFGTSVRSARCRLRLLRSWALSSLAAAACPLPQGPPPSGKTDLSSQQGQDRPASGSPFGGADAEGG